jgi:hypothetical protein
MVARTQGLNEEAIPANRGHRKSPPGILCYDLSEVAQHLWHAHFLGQHAPQSGFTYVTGVAPHLLAVSSKQKQGWHGYGRLLFKVR